MSSFTDARSDADLIIVGGGILGASFAYHAVSRGLRVVLLERHAAPRGATVRNFGQVVPSGLNSRWQHFGRKSLAIYNKLQGECDLTVRNQGSIYLASDEEELTLLEELHAINRQADYESELWTLQQCLQRFPNLRRDYCRGGLNFPQEISVNPRMMIHRLHEHLNHQANYRSCFQQPVRELSRDGDVVVATTCDQQEFVAKRAIVCGGAEFRTLFPELFRSSPLEAVKIQMLRLKPSPSVRMPGNILTGLSIRRYEAFSECPSWSEIKAREPRESFARQWGIHILFKQEQDGGIILGDSHEYANVEQSDQLSFEVRQDINEYLVAAGREIFDLPSWQLESSWYGLYSQTDAPSGIFTRTIDESIHIVTGIGGKGMTSSLGFAGEHLKEILNV